MRNLDTYLTVEDHVEARQWFATAVTKGLRGHYHQ